MNDRRRAWQIVHLETRRRVLDQPTDDDWQLQVGAILLEVESSASFAIELAGFAATFAQMPQSGDLLSLLDRLGAEIMSEPYDENDDDELTSHTDDCIHEPTYQGTDECAPATDGTWMQPRQYLVDATREMFPAAPWCRIAQQAWELDRHTEVQVYQGSSSDIEQWIDTENPRDVPFIHWYRRTSATDAVPEGYLLFVPCLKQSTSDWFIAVPNPAATLNEAMEWAKAYLIAYYRKNPRALPAVRESNEIS